MGVPLGCCWRKHLVHVDSAAGAQLRSTVSLSILPSSLLACSQIATGLLASLACETVLTELTITYRLRALHRSV
jgi:hypothetical protein